MNSSLRMVPVRTSERAEFLDMATQHFRELNPAFIPARDWEDSYFENIQQNPSYFLRWIVVEEQRAGFILYGVEDHRFLPRKTGVIYELYIVPVKRRKGIARACAMQAIDELRRLSPSKIQLEVVTGNAVACELWKSLGFREVTERLVLHEEISA